MDSQSDKLCKVCGDKALGFNFNGLSCEPCKAFFRRNAFDYEQMQCQLGGNCKLSKYSRKYCRKCRLDKCFSIGMQKELIFRYRENMSPISPENTKLISNEHTLDLKIHEASQLAKLQKAVAAFRDENSYEVEGEVTLLNQVLNFPASNAREVIRFCIKMPDFAELSKLDQLSVLKSFYPEKIWVRIAFLYSLEKDGWPGLENENSEKTIFMPMNLLKKWVPSDIFLTFHRFILCLNNEMENDKAICDLILALLLFKPRQTNSQIHRPEMLHYYHMVYCYLLRRYLEQKYQNKHESEQKYEAIAHNIEQIDSVSEALRQVYAEASTSIVQVLSEVFNLDSAN